MFGTIRIQNRLLITTASFVIGLGAIPAQATTWDENTASNGQQTSYADEYTTSSEENANSGGYTDFQQEDYSAEDDPYNEGGSYTEGTSSSTEGVGSNLSLGESGGDQNADQFTNTSNVNDPNLGSISDSSGTDMSGSVMGSVSGDSSGESAFGDIGADFGSGQSGSGNTGIQSYDFGGGGTGDGNSSGGNMNFAKKLQQSRTITNAASIASVMGEDISSDNLQNITAGMATGELLGQFNVDTGSMGSSFGDFGNSSSGGMNFGSMSGGGDFGF